MANATQNKLYRTFVKGLITEASPLTYPEDSSLDELNTVPSRRGNRTRRLGMDYTAGDAVARVYDADNAMSEFTWKSVNRISSLTFLVVQNGSILTFYDRTQSAFASSVKGFTLDLNGYTRPGMTNVSQNNCQFASGKGFLFVVQRDIEPLVVSYDPVSDTITVTQMIILGRDFEGLADGLQNDEEPSTLSTAHFYNLLNQGWVTPRT